MTTNQQLNDFAANHIQVITQGPVFCGRGLGLTDLVEGLVFKVGGTMYSRIGREIINLSTFCAVDPVSFLAKRGTRDAYAVAVYSAVNNA